MRTRPAMAGDILERSAGKCCGPKETDAPAAGGASTCGVDFKGGVWSHDRWASSACPAWDSGLGEGTVSSRIIWEKVASIAKVMRIEKVLFLPKRDWV